MRGTQNTKKRERERKPQAYDERDVRERHILLHACCAPDATAIIESWLPVAARISVYFFNPNIHPAEEHARRLEAMRKVAQHFGIALITSYSDAEIEACNAALVKYSAAAEGGERCEECYRHRLRATACKAAELDMDAFATTLTISPHKSHSTINALGMAAAAEFGIDYIATNFKKGGGFKRSVELSRALGIYRQDYCGCRWSIR